MSLKTNLWLAVSYRKLEVKIRVTWHLMFSKEKNSLSSLISFHFIISPFHSFSTPPHLFSFIHPPTTLHLINKVIFFTTKVFCAVGGHYCRFRSHLRILQPTNDSAALCTCINKKTQSVWNFSTAVVINNSHAKISEGLSGKLSETKLSGNRRYVSNPKLTVISLCKVL